MDPDSTPHEPRPVRGVPDCPPSAEDRLERPPPPCWLASSRVRSQSEKPWLALRCALWPCAELEWSCFMPELEGDESAAGDASRLAGAGAGVRVGAGVGASTGTVACTGAGSGGYELPGSEVFCACKTAPPAESAMRKMHNWTAKDIRWRE